jgi:phosphohistidine phosphatase
MKILFVRHARAETRAEFKGDDDLQRPLTPAGRKEARKAFKRIAEVYPKPEKIISSKAVRAIDTADILANAFGVKGFEQSEELNPGCDMGKITHVLAGLEKKAEWIAIVGHDPDFTELVSEITADGSLRIDFKKAACVEVDVTALNPLKGELKAMLPPKIMTAL